MLSETGDASSSDWLLPFESKPIGGLRRYFYASSKGRCTQGNDSNDSHSGELKYSFDFSLPVGTPILASASGEVAAMCSSHDVGGRSAEMRTKANFVVLRHGPGCYSRYYHLCKDGVDVQLGERVAAGARIGRSGNTGYSGSPHLHWDVVDVHPTETATLTLLPAAEAGSSNAPRVVECAAGSFSAALPPPGASIEGRVVWADPPTANAEALRNGAEAAGAVVMLRRCKDVDFIDKARRAYAAGAIAVIVVNTEEAGDAVLTMGASKSLSVEERTLPIPCIMVSHHTSSIIEELLISPPSSSAPPHSPTADGSPSPPTASSLPPTASPTAEGRVDGRVDGRVAISSSPHLKLRSLSGGPDPQRRGDFVALTQPARFLWPRKPAGWLPRAGAVPPKAVQAAALEPRRRGLGEAGAAERRVEGGQGGLHPVSVTVNS